MNPFDDMVAQLELKIQNAYIEGVTALEAEKLAAEFLHAQLRVSAELTAADLSARMRKSGVKAIKAAVYMNAATATDKKPTEAMLSATVDKDTVVQGQQDELDQAEVSKAELERLYDVFHESHVYFRGVAKGNFGG